MIYSAAGLSGERRAEVDAFDRAARIAGQVATIVRACIAGPMTREKEDDIRL
jgi:hypothetical protein